VRVSLVLPDLYSKPNRAPINEHWAFCHVGSVALLANVDVRLHNSSGGCSIVEGGIVSNILFPLSPEIRLFLSKMPKVQLRHMLSKRA